MPKTGSESRRMSMSRSSAQSPNPKSTSRRTSIHRPIPVRLSSSENQGFLPSSNRRSSLTSNQPIQFHENPPAPSFGRRSSIRRSSLVRVEDPENLLATKERSADGRSTPTPGSPARSALTDSTNSKKKKLTKRIRRRSVAQSYPIGGEPITTKCKHCGEDFPTTDLKFAHIKADHPDKPRFKCVRRGCGRQFDNKYQLKVHKSQDCKFQDEPIEFSDFSDSSSESE